MSILKEELCLVADRVRVQQVVTDTYVAKV
jgi:hypothetical protein